MNGRNSAIKLVGQDGAVAPSISGANALLWSKE